MVEEMYKDFQLRKQINELEESNSALREENLKLKRLLEATKDIDVLKEPFKDSFYQPCEKCISLGTSSSNFSSTKNQEDNQVCEEVRRISFSIPSDDDVNDASFVDFENHTKGIGMKLFTKMGYDRRDLGVNVQGIINPIEVKRQPHKAGLGYTEIGESSKSTEARKSNHGGNGDGKHSPRRDELNLVLPIKV